MNPISHPLLWVPRSARRIARVRLPANAKSRRSFQQATQLRSSTEPPHGAPRSAAKSENAGKSNTLESAPGARRPAAIPSKPAAPAEDTQEDGEKVTEEPSGQARQQSFHGSGLKRRLRNLATEKPSRIENGPDWFLEHNVHLRNDVRDGARPQMETLDKTSQGYFIPFLESNSTTSLEDFESVPQYNAETKGDGLATSESVSDLRGHAPAAPTRTDTMRRLLQQHFRARSPAGLRLVETILKQSVLHAQRRSEESSSNNQDLPEILSSIEDSIHEMEGGPELLTSYHGSIVSALLDTLQPNSEGETTSRPRYFLDGAQDLEIRNTARGLLKLHQESARGGDNQEHLLLLYPPPGGEALLDTLVHRISSDLQADLIVLDAQDISELIVNDDIGDDFTAGAKMLSYEAYGKDVDDAQPFSMTPGSPLADDDMEIPDTPAEHHFGVPIIIGKNLSDFMAQQFRSPMRSKLPRGLEELLGSQQRRPKQKTKPSIFTPLIEQVLSASRRKLETKIATQRSSNDTDALPKLDVSASLIVHIRDLLSIQESPVGKQFLLELYSQVRLKRSLGESVMIIGTEASTYGYETHDPAWLKGLQKHSFDEISRTIFVTPVTPDNNSKLAILEDRKLRTARINLRNLWNLVKQKNPGGFYDLKAGFWASNVTKNISEVDFQCLQEKVWPFSHASRVATYLIGILCQDDRKSGADSIFLAVNDLAKSDNTKLDWAKESNRAQRFPGVAVTTHENSRLAEIQATATKYEKRLLSGVIEASKIRTTFNDVHAPIETIDALQTLTTLSLVRPDAFKYGVLASDRIPGLLLYGPPGTGKTLLAKAVAKESGSTVLEVSAADINDMYVGEGEKNVQALFSLAKKLSPCIIFLDEADAMFSARSMSGKRVSHRELLNQFLKEWDGMSNDSGSAFLMVATNRPMDLDDAVLRRLPRRLLVDLPTEADRHEILKIHLRNEFLGSDVDLADLASKTPFYSGSDLKNVAVGAALNCVREENEMAKKHEGEEPYQYAERRTLTAKHFTRALEEITASISEDMSSLREIKKFDEQYGDRRGKKKKSGRFGFKNSAESDKVLDTAKVRA